MFLSRNLDSFFHVSTSIMTHVHMGLLIAWVSSTFKVIYLLLFEYLISPYISFHIYVFATQNYQPVIEHLKLKLIELVELRIMILYPMIFCFNILLLNICVLFRVLLFYSYQGFCNDWFIQINGIVPQLHWHDLVRIFITRDLTLDIQYV